MRDFLPPHVVKFFWPDANPEDIQDQYSNLVHQHRKKQKRINVISWADINHLTKRIAELQQVMAKYASSGYEDAGLGGDQNVFVELITLQNLIQKLRDKHAEANRERNGS